MRSLKWVLLALVSFIFHSGIAIAYVPVPDPPEIIYRIDDRHPDVIFAQGFQPWSTQSPDPNEGFVDHITGVSVRARTSHWVSASGSETSMLYTLRDLARQRDGFPTHIWVYEMSPNEDSFSVNWAVEDAIEEFFSLPYTPSVTDTLRNYLRAYYRQDEWATRSGLQSHQIRRAVRYAYSQGNWIQTGEVRNNPSYRPRPLPPRQRVNPITQQQRLDEIPVYGYEIDWFALGIATFARWVSLGISCEGATGPSNSNRNNNNSQYCDKDLIEQVPIPNKAHPSKLYVTDHLGDKFCWAPSLSGKWSGTYHFSLNLKLVNCGDESQFGYAEYDELQRLVYYWNGIEYCVTAPSSVSAGSGNWDWITLEPCVTNNLKQVWNIYKGKIYSQGTGLYIQDWKYFAILSGNNTGYDNTLDESKMPASFFTEPSPVRSLMSEIGLGWRWNYKTYYSTDNGIEPWGSVYLKRTYYDSLTQKIVMYTWFARAFQSDFPQVKCLSSRQVRKGNWPWDWADWKACRQREATGKEYQFTINSRSKDIAKPVRVIVKDYSKNTLWFQATGQNAGFPFTGTKNYSSNSTDDLVVKYSAYTSPFFFYSKGTK